MSTDDLYHRCPRCARLLPRTPDWFYFARSGKRAGQITGYCRPCMAGWQRDRVRSADEVLRRRRYARDWARRRRATLGLPT